MATVQLFRRERRSSARFDEINSAHRDANVDSILYYAVFYPAIEVIGALASALIIWFGGGWTMEGTLTLGSLVAFLQYSQRFFRPISDMRVPVAISRGSIPAGIPSGAARARWHRLGEARRVWPTECRSGVDFRTAAGVSSFRWCPSDASVSRARMPPG